MENIKREFIPNGQVVNLNTKTTTVKKFIAKNKMVLLISIVSIVLLTIEASLVKSFIDLLVTL